MKLLNKEGNPDQEVDDAGMFLFTADLGLYLSISGYSVSLEAGDDELERENTRIVWSTLAAVLAKEINEPIKIVLD